ncbi:hypothetical protein TNCT_79061, partial [Trichonephila clavata]
GKKCQYRHSEEAKSTQFVCPLFVEKCFAVSCKFRHPKNKQKYFPCVYENQPANPYIIDPKLKVQTEVGEKKKQIAAANSEELMKIHVLLKEPDFYSTAYNAPAQKTPQGFKYKKGNPYSVNLKKTTKEFQHVEKINQDKFCKVNSNSRAGYSSSFISGNSKSLNFKIKILEEIKNEKKQNQGKRKFLNETEGEIKKLKLDNGISNKENKVCCKGSTTF